MHQRRLLRHLRFARTRSTSTLCRSKNAQEAHEAIRPINVRLTPASLAKKMDPKALKLYDLIWSTSVACQMTDARIKTLSFDFGDDEGSVLLRSSMSAVIFPGHQALFKEREEGNRQNAKLLESMAQLQPKAAAVAAIAALQQQRQEQEA